MKTSAQLRLGVYSSCSSLSLKLFGGESKTQHLCVQGSLTHYRQQKTQLQELTLGYPLAWPESLLGSHEAPAYLCDHLL